MTGTYFLKSLNHEVDNELYQERRFYLLENNFSRILFV